MKKIFTYLILLLSFLGMNGNVIRTFADSNPFALIQTIYDVESNDQFQNAISITQGSFTNVVTSYSDYKAGTIGSGTDVDNYTFNLYANSNVQFSLTSLDTAVYHLLDYDFKIYKQLSKANPGYNLSDMQLLYTSSAAGANDYYSALLNPGTYYVQIYCDDKINYDNRSSYKLGYYIRTENKTSLNINDYVDQHDNSYLVWSSDYNVFDRKDLNGIDINGIYHSQIPESGDGIQRADPHPLDYEFWRIGGFLNMEIYLWGKQMRIEVFNALNDACQQLEYDLPQNPQISFDSVYWTVNEAMETVNMAMNLFVNGASYTLSSTFPLFSFVVMAYSFLTAPASTEYLEDMINYFQFLQAAVYHPATEADDSGKVICLSQKSYLRSAQNGARLVLNTSYINNNDNSNSLSKYVVQNAYDHNYIYEVKEYKINGSSYSKIYGKIYYPSQEDSIFDFFNIPY